MSDTIEVYVSNLGRYNEGALRGGWIELPVEPEELNRFLTDVVGVELDPSRAHEASLRGERIYEEYFITDFQYSGLLETLGFKPHEHERLEDLNLLAKVAESTVWDEKAVAAVHDYDTISDPLELANLILQSDEIPFYGYEVEGMEHGENDTCEEKYGRTVAALNGLTAKLDELSVDDYFDYERYGSDAAQDCILTESGYLDCFQDFPDLDYYDRDDLLEDDPQYYLDAKELFENLVNGTPVNDGSSDTASGAASDAVSEDASGNTSEAASEAAE